MDDSGPQNAVVGDDNFGTDLPETKAPADELAVEKNMARFSKTKEFKKLKDVIEAKIKFYQEFLPDGRPVNAVAEISGEELALNWKVANTVIGEFQSILDAYELAKDAVKNDPRGTS